MAITRTQKRRFIFENASGIKYDVQLKAAGTGTAYKLTGTSSKGDGPKNAIAKVALTVDAGAISKIVNPRIHTTYFCHAAIFNSSATLVSVLNASS